MQSAVVGPHVRADTKRAAVCCVRSRQAFSFLPIKSKGGPSPVGLQFVFIISASIYFLPSKM